MLHELLASGIREAVILSTCNRTEIYAVADGDIADTSYCLHSVLARRQALAPETCYLHVNESAVSHVFRVAAGLESAILGESEITAQVKHAYLRAQDAGATGAVLNQLFQKALHCAKRVRTETGIASGHASIGAVVAALMQEQCGPLAGRTALLWGAGKAAEATALHLAQAGLGTLRVVNRTDAKAQDLAARCRGEWLSWEQARRQVHEADAVIICTQAPHYVLGAEDFAVAGARPALVIDLAVPRNVDPAVGSLPGVRLWDIDAVQQRVRQALDARAGESAAGQRIIDNQVTHWRARIATRPEEATWARQLVPSLA